MPLLKYTTEVPVAKTVGEIQAKLQAAGAQAVLVEYGPDRQPASISFRIETPHGVLPFRLPANVEHTTKLLQRQYQLGRVPRAAIREGQPARVVWRIVKDWLEAQLALIEIEAVTLDQVFLPYLSMGDGKTLYEVMAHEGGLQRLLGPGGE